MAKQKQTKDRRYEKVYGGFRDLAQNALALFGRDLDTSLVVTGAQAEALVRTLRGYTLRKLPQKDHARYLHWLFNMMLGDLTRSDKRLVARLLVVDKRGARPKRTKKKRGKN